MFRERILREDDFVVENENVYNVYDPLDLFIKLEQFTYRHDLEKKSVPFI